MQLGKLDHIQADQDDSCKTAPSGPQSQQRVTGVSQNAETQFPVIIAEWERNKREVIRVALDQYNGRYTVNVRVWHRDGDQLKPGRTGLTLALKHLPKLASGLASALSRAKVLGLISTD